MISDTTRQASRSITQKTARDRSRTCSVATIPCPCYHPLDMRSHAYLALLMCTPGIGCSIDDATAEVIAPVAAVRPYAVISPHGTRNDDYYWLREREDPDVLSYLEAENAYKDAVLVLTTQPE